MRLLTFWGQVLDLDLIAMVDAEPQYNLRGVEGGSMGPATLNVMIGTMPTSVQLYRQYTADEKQEHSTHMVRALNDARDTTPNRLMSGRPVVTAGESRSAALKSSPVRELVASEVAYLIAAWEAKAMDSRIAQAIADIRAMRAPSDSIEGQL